MSATVSIRPDLLGRLREFPYGAAVKTPEQVARALESDAPVLFVLRSDGLEIASLLARVHAAGKLAAVHLDLVGGLSSDHVGVRWLVRSGADAIITSHGHLVRTIRAEAAVAIQRLLLADMASVRLGLAAVRNARPDIVELLPGAILPQVQDLVLPQLGLPLLAGGLIRSRACAGAVLAAGAVAVSTSSAELWT